MLFVISCDRQNEVTYQLADDYIQRYQERSDFKSFMDLYSEKVLFEDIILGYQSHNKRELAEFFNWEDPAFQKEHQATFEVSTLNIDANKIMIQGHFNSFKWKDKSYGPMKFVTLLELDKNGKIERHTDWINYPFDLLPKESRNDSNQWIGK